MAIEAGDRVMLAPRARVHRLDALNAATADVLPEQLKWGPLTEGPGQGAKGTVLRCIVHGAREGEGVCTRCGTGGVEGREGGPWQLEGHPEGRIDINSLAGKRQRASRGAWGCSKDS